MEQKKYINLIISQVILKLQGNKCWAEKCPGTLEEGLTVREAFLKWALDVRVKWGFKGWQRFCAGGGLKNGSSERQRVSPGECSARGGHRTCQGPLGRISLTYEHRLGTTAGSEDGWWSATLWKEHSGCGSGWLQRGRYEWTWEMTWLALRWW